MFQKTKQFCDSFLEYGLPGFDVIAYKDGECIFRYMNGYSDLENKVKISGNEKYNIYSCSKVITCTAALMLWEKGLFSLEDKLSDYMPEFSEMYVKTENGLKKAENPILIKHLFEMTAGFSYDTESPQIKKCIDETDGKCPTREMIKYLAKEPLLFEPGERWEYSLCHDVLAAFIEFISGEKFEDFIKNNIFSKLGMNNSSFMESADTANERVVQYRYRNGKGYSEGRDIVCYKFGSEYASGGAGCISTVEDYIKFAEALRKGELIKPETVKLMMTDRLKEEQKTVLYGKARYGYGLGVRCPKGDDRYVDFGWSGAAGAHTSIDMQNGITIFVGANMFSFPFMDIYGSMLCRFIKAELYGEDFKQIGKDVAEFWKTLEN
ncbi:MAG: beta-lactamase family protein [Ruminococcaceae bacterium]|nr:beta-lactamase family protein [Oscillospiraceae bacterium]